MNPIFPSILSTTFFDLEAKLTDFRANGIEVIHLDVMDGHFVEQISFGAAMLTAIRSRFDFAFDSHLMVDNPEKAIPFFLAAGAEWISFHIETPAAIGKSIALIRQSGSKPGLALNPDTPVERVYPFLQDLDYVLLMSVFPGYGGQKFMESSLERIRQLKRKILSDRLECRIEVDGGIRIDDIARLQDAGVDWFVMGTSLFHAGNIRNDLDAIANQLKGRKK
jgi:ribulose-phosphate 3-epimerase